MTDRAITVRISAVDSFSSVVDAYKRKMGEAETATKNVGDAAQQQGGKFKVFGTDIEEAMGYLAVGAIVKVGSELVNLGGQINVTQARFHALAGSGEGSLQVLRDATGGVISDFELMQTTASAIMTGIAKDATDAGRLINLGLSLGGTEGVEKLFQALRNQSYLVLDTVGISAGQVRELAEQYREAGMTSADAFNAAVVSVGEKTQASLGDAATAGITELGKFETWLDNFKNRYAENARDLAEIAAGAINNVVNGLGTQQHNESESGIRAQAILPGLRTGVANGLDEGFVNDYVTELLYSLAQNPEIAAQAELTGAQLSEWITLGLLSATPETISGAGGEAAMRQWLGTLTEEVFRQNQNITRGQDIVGQQLDQMRAGLTEIQAFAQRMQTEIPNFISEGGSNLLSRPWMDMATEAGQQVETIIGDNLRTVGGVEYFTGPIEEVDRLALRAEEALGQLELLNEDGSISDETLESYQALNDRLGNLRDKAQEGKDKVDELRESLRVLFGQSGGGAEGDITDQMVKYLEDMGVPQTTIEEYQSEADTRSGRQTELSQWFETEGKAILARILVEEGPEAAAQAQEAFVNNLAAAIAGGQPVAADPTAYTGYTPVATSATGTTFTIVGAPRPRTLLDQYNADEDSTPEGRARQLAEQFGVPVTPEMINNFGQLGRSLPDTPAEAGPIAYEMVASAWYAGDHPEPPQGQVVTDLPEFQQAVEEVQQLIIQSPTTMTPAPSGMTSLYGVQQWLAGQGQDYTIEELMGITGAGTPWGASPGTYTIPPRLVNTGELQQTVAGDAYQLRQQMFGQNMMPAGGAAAAMGGGETGVSLADASTTMQTSATSAGATATSAISWQDAVNLTRGGLDEINGVLPVTFGSTQKIAEQMEKTHNRAKDFRDVIDEVSKKVHPLVFEMEAKPKGIPDWMDEWLENGVLKVLANQGGSAATGDARSTPGITRVAS